MSDLGCFVEIGSKMAIFNQNYQLLTGPVAFVLSWEADVVGLR